MVRPRPLFVLLALCACTGGGGSSTDPIPGLNDPPELVYCRSRSDGAQNDTQVRKASARGLGEARILDRGGVESGVRVAADGNRLVYSRERDSGHATSREVFVGTVDGSAGELRLTVNDAIDDQPCWSPDGGWIACSSDRLGQGRRLFLMRPDGSDATPLYDDGSEQREPDWSAATDRIAFSRVAPGGRAEIWIVDRDGRVAAPLTDGGTGTANGGESAGDHEPAWSPDGTVILCSRDVAPGVRVLLTVEVATGVATPLTPPDGDQRLPRWSPLGDRIFFAANRLADGIANRRLWTARPDGSDRAALFGDKRYEFLGIDALPSIGPAPSGSTEDVDADVGAAKVSNGLGRLSRGTIDNVLDRDGVLYGLATVLQGTRHVAGIEFDVALPVTDPYEVRAVEFSAMVGLTETDATSELRLAIGNFVANRNDTVVEIHPPSGSMQQLSFSTVGLQHVTRDARVRFAVVGENPETRPGELLIDDVRIRVRRPMQPPAGS